MITHKFTKSMDDVLIQGYVFQTQFLLDKADFIAVSPQFADPFGADFLVDLQAADALPTYENDLAEQSYLSQLVEEKMEQCRVHFQKLTLFVNTIWPGNEGFANIFGIYNYLKARSSSLKMINLLQVAYDQANSLRFKADLIAGGFLQTDITLLDTLATELLAVIKNQQAYINAITEKAQTRTIAFNKFWDTMVLISNFSKEIYAANPAKITMYLLYPDNPIPLPPGVPQNLAYAEVSHLFSWDLVATATSYQLAYREVGNVTWINLYEGTDTFVEFQPTVGDWEFAVRARNAGGYGDMSPAINVNVPEPLPAPTNVTVTWNPASSQRTSINFTPHSGTTSIDVHQSIVDVGAPAGTYTLLGNFPATSPIRQGGVPNMRIYVYLIAKSATEESEPSAVAFCDNV